MKKKLLSGLCVLAMAFSMAACSNNSTSTSNKTASASDKSKITLGISFGQNVHPFFVAMQKGAQDAANKEGVELVVQSANGSLETQTSQIENLVQSGVKAILLNPIDSKGVANAVNAAEAKKVGIFTMDIDTVGAKSNGYVASNNKKIGEMLADYVIKQLGGKGNIAILDDPTVTSLKERAEGFKAKLASSQIKIVAEQATAGQRTDSLSSAESILRAHPDIKAFIGVNENSAMGISSAVKAAGKSNIIVTGVDATTDVMNGIKDGSLAIGVSQDPYQMGYQSVENALKWIKGKKINTYTEIPVEYMNKGNIDKYITREAQYVKKQ